MCRFIGVISKSEFHIENYLKILENIAKDGKRSPHGDGWGLWIKNDNFELLHKETVPIWERKSEKFPRAKILFLHARKKGGNGQIALVNTHPFVRNNAVFMHNGVINIEHPSVNGTTDSEKMFLHILDKGLFNFLCNVDNYDFSSINSLLYLSGKIYAIRYARKLMNYYTLFLRKEGDKIIISTDLEGEEIENGSVVMIDEELNVSTYRICQDRHHSEDKHQSSR